jgi:hypothetical protein
MNADAIRLRLRTLESRGLLRSWWEIAPGSFVVTVNAGPNIKVRTARDVQALEDTIQRKAARP